VFRYSSRFWLYAPTGAFLLLAAAAMVHWWILAGAFEKKLAALKGHEAIPGVTLDWDSAEVGGFPFRIDADFVNLRVQGAGAHGPFAWKTAKFALHALTYGRRQTVYEAAGQQSLSWTDAAGAAHATSFMPGALHASSTQDQRGLARADLEIVELGSKDFVIGRLQFHMRRDPDGTDLDLMLRADNWGMRKQVQVYATLSHADTLAAILRGEKSWPETAAKWRAQGGQAKLTQVVAPDLDPAALLSPLF
jgi:hypothetical protein